MQLSEVLLSLAAKYILPAQRSLFAPGGMDVAQGGIYDTAVFQGFGIDGGITARQAHFAVDTEQVDFAVVWGGEAGKGVVLPVRGSEGTAVNYAAEGGERH